LKTKNIDTSKLYCGTLPILKIGNRNFIKQEEIFELINYVKNI
jgi:hypothetical protein